MAGRLIVMKNAVQQVKGDVEVADWKEWLRLDAVSFSTVAYTNSDSASGTVHQSSVSISIPFGPWIAELQQKLYHGTMLGDVEIIEIEQKVDAANNKTWKKIREISLLDGWVESFSHSWSGIHASVSMTVQYTDMTLAVADKVAHFSKTELAGK
jgi:hypothetical protein